MADCPRLEKCGFFKKHRETKHLACKFFIASYCKGPQQASCKRLEYGAQHGTPPSDDMMPTGQLLTSDR